MRRLPRLRKLIVQGVSIHGKNRRSDIAVHHGSKTNSIEREPREYRSTTAMTSSRKIALLMAGAAVAVGMLSLAVHYKPSPRAPAADKKLTVRMSVGKPTVLTVFPIEVDYSRNRVPLSGLHVVVNFTMPSMPMPENRAVLTESAPGCYTGKGILTMPGGWEARATASLSGHPIDSRVEAFNAR